MSRQRGLVSGSRIRESRLMRSPPAPHYGCRFPAEIIAYRNGLHHVFSLSLRDVELILAERGVLDLEPKLASRPPTPDYGRPTILNSLPALMQSRPPAAAWKDMLG